MAAAQLPNTVQKLSGRVIEFVPIGVLKNNEGTLEAPGAASAEPEGTVNLGTQYPLTGTFNTITGVTSFSNIFVGSGVSDASTLKLWPVAAKAVVTTINETAKTIGVSVEPVKSILQKREEKAESTKEKILFSNNLEAAGAETLTIPLVSQAYQFASVYNVQLTILEGTAAAKVKAGLETSADGGQKWVKIGSETAEVTEKGTAEKESAMKEKYAGNRFRLQLTFSAADKVAGYAVVSTNQVYGLGSLTTYAR